MQEKAEASTAGTVPTPPRPRSSFAKTAVLAASPLLLVSLGALLWPTWRCDHSLSRRSPPSSLASIDERVKIILSETPLIDGHNDLAYVIRAVYNNHIYDDNFTKPFEDGGFPYHVDLARLREGQNGGAFWSVYGPCPGNGTDFSEENYLPSVQFTLQQIDLVTRLQSRFPQDFSGIVDSESALAAFRRGQLISPLGIEGLHQIGNSAANLRRFHALGVRYITLTHNCGNAFADAALRENPFGVAPPLWGGVSPRGRLLINEMNRVGLIVDLSHTSVDTMRDVLGAGGDGWAGSKAPVIFSHSSAYAICPHPRNVPDDVLQLVKKTNSLVMVNFAAEFISCAATPDPNGVPPFDPAHNTLSRVAEHVTYIGSLIGYDHVGFGSDFDGITRTPEGLGDVSRYPDLVAELLRRGVSDADAAKVVGANVLRVWADAERVAAALQDAGEPILEDELPSFSGLGA
ncbi:putative dipeptidase [Durotheca rogersii]|uniref:putative dipeptidase n=1 Tax=Durotheca rogersii TaxID=419775 RepID=UPI0022210FC6|nr:putative dipeptidase [Durotheca rogersii]KAI5862820.1 putative dipeptidase [Durotheca rogersii]